MKKLLLGILFSFFLGNLNAAEIEAFDEQELSFIAFKGEIEKGDAYRLKKVIQDHDRYAKKPISVVFLNSFGGSVIEGVEIGKVIEQHKLITLVLPDNSCYSSCVLIFLSGQPRYAASKSNIGVHRISENSADTTIARSVSIELSQFYKAANVPDSIRLAMLETAPNEIYTLSIEEKKNISTIDLDQYFANNQTTTQKQVSREQRPSSKYKKFYNIPDLMNHLREIFEGEHDPNVFLQDIKNGYFMDVYGIVKNNIDPSLSKYLEEYFYLAQKQFNQITDILNNAGVTDLYIRNKIELDYWYYKMFDIAQFDPRSDWDNNHYLCSKTNCSERAVDMINLSFADHYNQLRELCVAGYCNEEMVKEQERTWIASNELSVKILKNVHPDKVTTNMPYAISRQIANINNLKFYISIGLKKTSYFNEFNYSTPTKLLVSVLELLEKMNKLTQFQMEQYNAVMGSYVLPHILYLIEQNAESEWSDKLDVASAAYDLVYREFYVSSNRIAFGPNYDKQNTEFQKLFGKVYRAVSFLLLLVPESELKDIEVYFMECKGINCKQDDFKRNIDAISKITVSIKKLCSSGKCNLKQFDRQLKHMKHYEQTYFEILNKLHRNSSYIPLIKILYLEPITLRYLLALDDYGKK